MTDREKVIRHITAEICIAKVRKKDFAFVDIDMLSDALTLLKEHEPKPPIVHENSYGWKFYYCPNCEKEFYQNRKQAYCEKCGQAVRWE